MRVDLYLCQWGLDEVGVDLYLCDWWLGGVRVVYIYVSEGWVGRGRPTVYLC